MKRIEARFTTEDMEMIRAMIGKTMTKYKCDPFEYSSSVYGIVGFMVESESFSITNLVEVMDYYGSEEDVAMFRIKRKPFSEIHSLIQDQEMIETPVESKIVEIYVVNDHQKLYEKDVQIYEVSVTRGIIFKFEDGHELSFEKNIWFSEDITVEKGYDLIQRFSPVEEFNEGWSGDYRGECYREIITIA